MRVALILSGCGYLDGSEIHEAVLAWTALDRAGARVTLAAPSAQVQPIDHLTGQAQPGRRDARVEAARIARGKLVDLDSLREADFDGLVLPGGYGAAKVLCDFESAGSAVRVRPDLARFAQAMHAARKPIGAICIAPAIVAALLRDSGERARLSLGNDPDMARALRELGQEPVDCAVDQCVVDEARRIVCTPAYMYDARISDVARGIDRLVEALVKMMRAAPVRAGG